MDRGFRVALLSTVVKNEFVVEISNKIVLIFCQRTALSMPFFCGNGFQFQHSQHVECVLYLRKDTLLDFVKDKF